MANALIQPYIEGTQAAATVPLYDPRHLRLQQQRYRRPPQPELALPNAFYAPAGLWPSRGWLLVRQGDYAALNLYATNLQLQIDDLSHDPLTIQNLSIVNARSVSAGVAGDADSIYLLEVTDGRGLVCNRWWQQPTTSQYNVPAPAYDGQYYFASLNAGVPWTWDGMVGDLWGQMSTLLGAYPGLPIAPAGTPTGFVFPGVPCWLALCRVLSLLGLAVAPNPTGGSYTIVQVGAADAAFTALQTKYATLLEDDLEWLDTGSGRVPKQATVYFHVRYQYYGTEETVRRDSFQWQSNPLYAVTVAGSYPNAVGTAYLWDDFVVRLDTNGSPLAADVATAATIATERAAEYFARITRNTQGYLKRTYTGVLPFVPGSLCDGVCWRQDFREPGRSGWRTETLRGTIWDECRFDLSKDVPDMPPFRTF